MISDSYHIYFDNDRDIVVMQWDGYSTSAQFREGTEKMLQELVRNKASKVLGDIRNMVLIGMEDQEWLNHSFLPRAIENGFRAAALVRPKHYFNQVAVESVSYKADSEKLSIKLFDDMAKAVSWLRGI